MNILADKYILIIGNKYRHKYMTKLTFTIYAISENAINSKENSNNKNDNIVLNLKESINSSNSDISNNTEAITNNTISCK